MIVLQILGWILGVIILVIVLIWIILSVAAGWAERHYGEYEDLDNE